jgi:DNA repair photolyase
MVTTADPMNLAQAYERTYHQLLGQAPPGDVTYRESDADIFSQGRGFMDGFDLTMQLQVGCPGGCLYCFVKAGRMLAPSAVKGPQGKTWGFVVRNKRHIRKKLQRHLEKGTLGEKTIYWSGVTDPYAAPPKMTRTVWQTLCDAPFPLRPRRIVVQTRFRPDRDVALIKRYCESTAPADQGPPVVVSFSLGTDRNDLIKAWEKATPSFEQRMNSIGNLREAGIFVVATLSPFGLWNDLQATLRQLKAWGVAYITVLFFKEHTRYANTPANFLGYLRQHYPVLLDPVWQEERVEEIAAIYGKNRVLVGQHGFQSLARPQEITQSQ